jgi:hypothetical protein
MKISRREFLRSIGFVGAAAVTGQVRLPEPIELAAPAVPMALVPENDRRILFKTDGVFTTDDISANPVVWYPATEQEWFELCCRLVCEAGKDIPQSRREINCHLPPEHADMPGIGRFSVDWYDGNKRYGFVIRWCKIDHLLGRPLPKEILAAALPFLHSRPEIGPRDRWLAEGREVWL